LPLDLTAPWRIASWASALCTNPSASHAIKHSRLRQVALGNA